MSLFDHIDEDMIPDVAVIRAELEKGADPNEPGLLEEVLRLWLRSKNPKAATAFSEITTLLLDHGADPTLPSGRSFPAGRVAIRSYDWRNVTPLMGPESRQEGLRGGMTPLGFAALQGRADMLRELIRPGPGRVPIDLNKKDSFGYTPLMWGLRSNNALELLSILCRPDTEYDDSIYNLIQRYQYDETVAQRVTDALRQCQESQIKTKARGLSEALAAPRQTGYKPPALPEGSRPPVEGPVTQTGMKPFPMGTATGPKETIGKFLGLPGGGKRRKTSRRRRHGKKRGTRKH
jgi:hypothetical protein